MRYDIQKMIAVIKEKYWSVAMQRASVFFREQEDVIKESANVYRFGTCCITLTELKPSP